MNVLEMELLSRHMDARGHCAGDVYLMGDGGERVQVRYHVAKANRMPHSTLNSAIAQDALRQVRRMPEYRNTEIGISAHAIPKPKTQRILVLPG